MVNLSKLCIEHSVKRIKTHHKFINLQFWATQDFTNWSPIWPYKSLYVGATSWCDEKLNMWEESKEAFARVTSSKGLRLSRLWLSKGDRVRLLPRCAFNNHVNESNDSGLIIIYPFSFTPKNASLNPWSKQSLIVHLGEENIPAKHSN